MPAQLFFSVSFDKCAIDQKRNRQLQENQDGHQFQRQKIVEKEGSDSEEEKEGGGEKPHQAVCVVKGVDIGKIRGGITILGVPQGETPGWLLHMTRNPSNSKKQQRQNQATCDTGPFHD